VIIGTPAIFAIETGAVDRSAYDGGIYIQFRFWIDCQPIGDWDDRIPLAASIENANTVIRNQPYRRERLFGDASPDEILRSVYDRFFEYDYTKDPIVVPNLRDRFHLDDIGMGAMYDKFGVVLVGFSRDVERILAKDLRHCKVLSDVRAPFGIIESVLSLYIEWGRSYLMK
jgi:hypothetical protein